MTKLGQRFFLILSTATVCMLVALIATVLLSAFSGHLGLLDLLEFAVWTAPYALIIAATTWPARRLQVYENQLYRRITAVLLGLFVSLLWTFSLGLLLGASIRALSFPGFYVWAIAGTAGFLHNFRLLSQGRIDTPSSPYLSWKAIILLLVFPFGCIVSMGLSLFTVSAISELGNEPQVFLFPEGYFGPVLIIYDRPEGQPPRYEGRARLYEIPESGVLLTQFSWPGGVDGEFWYVDEEGRRVQEIVWYQNCVGDGLPGDPVVACTYGVLMGHNGQRLPRHTYLIVGPQSEHDALNEGAYEWKVDILTGITD